jgi:hypothetical protein
MNMLKGKFMMGKWVFRLLLLTLIFSACYLLYGMLEMDREVSARNASDGGLHKTTNYKTLGFKKLRLPIQSLNNKQIAVYYVPHPDDEILTYGVPIRNDLQAGKVVYLVLFTHGESSAIIRKLNDMVTLNLTKNDLGLARKREFILSSQNLGIDDNHKDIYNPKDIKYRIELIRKLAIYFENTFPHVTHNGMSKLDILKDHSLTGMVLDQLYKQGDIKHKNTYASIFMSRVGKKRLSGKKILLTNKGDEFFLDQSIMSYSRWDPKRGWYACGNLSVRNQFKSFSAKKYSILTKE